MQSKRLISHPGASFFRLLAVFALVALVTGCSTLREVRRQPVLLETNAVAHVIQIPAQTNRVESPAGPVEVVTPGQVVTNWTTNITGTIHPALISTLNAASTVNRLANPTPAAPFVELGLTALAGVLGFVARLKAKRAQREMDRANQANELLETVIAGVEVAKDEKTKASIAEMSKLWGTRNALHQKVQTLTRNET